METKVIEIRFLQPTETGRLFLRSFSQSLVQLEPRLFIKIFRSGYDQLTELFRFIVGQKLNILQRFENEWFLRKFRIFHKFNFLNFANFDTFYLFCHRFESNQWILHLRASECSKITRQSFPKKKFQNFSLSWSYHLKENRPVSVGPDFSLHFH